MLDPGRPMDCRPDLGAQFTPRVGMEVIVAFLEGDPEPAARGGHGL